MSLAELVYDWNTIDPELTLPNRHIGFDDETLRDGLQSPSVSEPPVEQKIELLHLMDALGILAGQELAEPLQGLALAETGQGRAR